MNYLGHAAVASWKSPKAAFVLAAMLPDFASFLQLPLPTPADPTLCAGIDFHHATDRAFHRAPVFRALSRQSLGELQALGIPRGPARATSHVGLEMLIDVNVARAKTVIDSFRLALALAQTEGFVDALGLPPADHERLVGLARVIETRGSRIWSGDPTAIAHRLQRTFASRPRLCLAEHHLAPVQRWLARTLPLVDAEGPALERQLRSTLIGDSDVLTLQG